MIIHRLTSGQRGNGQEILNRFLMICTWLFLAVSVIGCSSEERSSDEVVVFAATSVQTALQEVVENFQTKHGINVRLNVGASGATKRGSMRSHGRAG